MTNKIIIIILLTVHIAQAQRTLYTTNEVRTNNINTYCNNITFSITDEERTTNTGYMSTLKTYFSGDAEQIVTYIVKLDITGLQTQLQTIGWGFILYAGPFLLGLVVLLIMWPFIVCCCVCPASCPSECCRKSKKQMYGNCQLLTPLLFSAFFMFVCIGTSIPAMTRSQPYFSKFQCSSSMFVDNILNGNVTESGSSYFSGLTTLIEQLTFLSGNLTFIKTEIEQLDGSGGTVMETANNHATTALTSISTMPNGVDTNQLSLSYSYPLHDTTNNTGTLNSAFTDVLGTYLTTNTLTNGMYNVVKGVKDSLESIKNSSAEVAPQMTSANMGANIDELKDSINPLIDNVKKVDDLLTSILQYTNSVDTYFDQYAVAYYGCVLGFGVLVICALVLIKCFKNVGCRHLLYLSCFFMFFLCLAGLIISSSLAITLPVLYYSCDYLNTSLGSADSFMNMVNLLGGSSYSNVGTHFSVCLSGGDGDIINSLHVDIDAQINHLTTSVFGVNNYNFTQERATVQSQFTSVKNTIDNYGTGKIPDFDTTSTFGSGQISTFNTINSKTAYTTFCPPGSFSVFYTDVWVPSTYPTYTNLVSCLSKVAITTTDCTSGLATACSFSRCLDAFDFIVAYNGAGGTAQLETDIDARYGTTCTLFNNHMKSFYTRYVTVVDDNIGNSADDHADTGKAVGRFMDSKNKTDTLLNYMDNTVKPLFESISAQLQNTTSSITNPTQGLLAGLNCQLIGDDLVRLKDSVCVTMFNGLFFSFVTTGLISFSLLFALCCTICTGIQYYKDAVKRKIYEGEVGAMKDKDQTASVIQI